MLALVLPSLLQLQELRLQMGLARRQGASVLAEAFAAMSALQAMTLLNESTVIGLRRDEHYAWQVAALWPQLGKATGLKSIGLHGMHISGEGLSLVSSWACCPSCTS
jgi:hypothetical protein